MLCSLLQKGNFPLSAPPILHLFCRTPNLKHANQFFHLNPIDVYFSSPFLTHVPVQDWMFVFFLFFSVAMSLTIITPSLNYSTLLFQLPSHFNRLYPSPILYKSSLRFLAQLSHFGFPACHS